MTDQKQKTYQPTRCQLSEEVVWKLRETGIIPLEKELPPPEPKPDTVYRDLKEESYRQLSPETIEKLRRANWL